VHDAIACRQPLHVAHAVTGLGTRRIGMIDEAALDDRDRLEAAMRMCGKSRHGVAVVHVPAIPAGEVLPDVAAGQRCARRPHFGVARRVGVAMVDAEQERVQRAPLKAEWKHVDDGFGHYRSSFRLLLGCPSGRGFRSPRVSRRFESPH
jgi:hypothetical protein